MVILLTDILSSKFGSKKILRLYLTQPNYKNNPRLNPKQKPQKKKCDYECTDPAADFIFGLDIRVKLIKTKLGQKLF